MTLAQLDQIINQIAGALFDAVPLTEWESVDLVARMSPDTKNTKLNYQFRLATGGIDTSRINLDSILKITELLEKHRQLVDQMGYPWWFEIRMNVSKNGRYKVDFGYRDSYAPEDLADGFALPS